MGQLFSYALTSAILLALGYLVFKWTMAGERQHAYNRFSLYIIYFLSLLIPALAIDNDNAGINPPSAVEHEIEIGEISGGLILEHVPEQMTTSEDIFTILTYIYIFGIAATFLYSIYGIIQLLLIIRKGKKIRQGEYTLVISDREDIAPFSWISYYVMSRKDYEESYNLIAIHELRHLKLRHWADLMFAQLINIFQWFNPAAWLMCEEFKTVHEYQADEAVLSADLNIKEYQTLLIKKAVGTRFQVLANSLNHSKLKKRVTMMYKTKSSKMRRMGAILLVPAMGIGCLVMEIPAVASVINATSEVSLISNDNGKVNEIPLNPEINFTNSDPEETSLPTADQGTVISEEATGNASSNMEMAATMDVKQETAMAEPTPPAQTSADSPAESSDENKDKDKREVYVATEKIAEYPGGMAELMRFLSNNIKYPEDAHKNGIQGRVIVKFIVEKDGTIGDATIVRGIDPSLDQEALRIVKEMPKWIPAQNNGEDVASYFNLPITFKLRGDDNKETKNTEAPVE